MVPNTAGSDLIEVLFTIGNWSQIEILFTVGNWSQMEAMFSIGNWSPIEVLLTISNWLPIVNRTSIGNHLLTAGDSDQSSLIIVNIYDHCTDALIVYVS